MRKTNPRDYVTASEVAAYAYCPEAWRLQYGLGFEPENRRELARGEAWHAETTAAEVSAGGFRRLGFALLLIALLIAAVVAFKVLR